MDDTICIVVANPGPTQELLHKGGPAAQAVALAGKVVEVSAEKLRSQLAAFCTQLGQVFTDLRAVGAFRLDEVTVGIEITAEAGIRLIASGTAGATASIQLTFKRSEAAG